MRDVAKALLCVYAVVLAAPSLAQERAGADAEFRQLLVARYIAMADGDTAAIRPQLAHDLIWVIGATGDAVGKDQLLSLVARVQNPRPRFDVDSVRVRQVGDVALVDYRRTDHRQLGTYHDTVAWRVVEIFITERHRWRLSRHEQAWVMRPPPAPVALDSAALAAFIGHYQIGPGYVDDVHREAGGLMATATGQSTGARLVPVSEVAFLPDGVGPLMVFERDASGRVLGYVQGLPDGRVVRARKMQ
jgi:ketosteroid isomerase-like protein